MLGFLARDTISSSIGNWYPELSNLCIIYFLLVPRTCASTVITIPSKLLFYAISINFKFISQSLQRYACNNFNPSGFTFVIYFGCTLVNVLKMKGNTFLLATLAVAASPSQCTILFIAHGAKPTGMDRLFPNRLVFRQIPSPSRKTLGSNTRFLNALLLFLIVT